MWMLEGLFLLSSACGTLGSSIGAAVIGERSVLSKVAEASAGCFFQEVLNYWIN